jgi:putative transposase
MSHVSCRLHVIFSTKNRVRSIPADLQPRLWEYLAGICRNLEVKVLAVGGFDDHCHMLIGLSATITIAELMQKVKANSSRWMRNDLHRTFEWQEGYSAFSVSISHVDQTIKYIRNQPEHHKRRTFSDELEAILKKHGLLAKSAVPAGL